MKKNKLKLVLLSFAILSTAKLAIAQKPDIPTYEVGMPINIVPYDMLDKDAMPIGFEVDVLKAVSKKEGFNLHYTTMPFSALFNNLEQENVDIISGAIFLTPERQKLYEASLPYYEAPRLFLVKDPALKDLSADSLLQNNKIRFTAPAGSVMLKDLVNQVGDEERVNGATTPFIQIKSLFIGKSDVAYQIGGTLRYYAKKRPGLFLIPSNSAPDKLVFYVKKGRKELINKINNGIKQIESDGTLKALINKWFNE